jgi:hypothetical protein
LWLRRSHPPAHFRFYGPDSAVDTTFESRSLAWSAGGLYVIVNAGWEPVRWEIQEAGPWVEVFSTSAGSAGMLAPRSIAVWRSDDP